MRREIVLPQPDPIEGELQDFIEPGTTEAEQAGCMCESCGDGDFMFLFNCPIHGQRASLIALSS